MTNADLETDVLVIGGGLAGLRAATAAREAGAQVAIAVKGKLGRSGCSAMTTAGFAASLPGLGLGDTCEAHAADTIAGGAHVGDAELIAIMCREAAGELDYLERLGALFQRDGERYRLTPSGDHSRPRVLLTPNNLGVDLTVPLAAHAEAIGVRKLEFTMAVELVTGEGAVVGAVCFDLRTKRFMTVAANATVLATGGAGRLFTMTSNPNDITGDGFALAAGAGARLRDMEFIQFYPWRCIDPFDNARVSIQPSTFVLGARLYNAAGERFMQAFNPSGAEVSTRDIGARGIFDQMRAGLGVRGGARLDLSGLSPAEFERSNPKVAKYVKGMNIDYATYPFILSPEAHYWMGGVAIDTFGATSIDGLYSAGETAGGIHGANRLNSNAIPDTLVFGARAGARAAAVAKSGRNASLIGPAARAWEVRTTQGPGLPDVALTGRLGALRQRMWTSLGIIRNAETMQDGLAHVCALRQELTAAGPGDAANLRRWLELLFLCEVGEQGLTSALARQESRGAHYREDFPTMNDAEWRGSVMIERRDGGYAVTLSPLRINHAA